MDVSRLDTSLGRAALVAAAVLAAAAVLIERPRLRGLAMLGALVLTPVLLLIDIWETDQFEVLRDRPSVAAAAGGAALLGLVVLAAVFARRPHLLALFAFAALPFRIPIEAAGQTANLLVPLYGVIGAGVLSRLPALFRGREASGTNERPPGRLALLLVGFLVLYALQATYADDFEVASQQVVFFYVPFALLFGLLLGLDWNLQLLKRCAGVVLALALILAVVGFVEYATRELLLNPKVIAANAFGSYFRVNSLFFDPNIYGRFLAEVMVVVAAAAAWSTKRREVGWLAAALAFLWAALILTFSQSSFAALLAGLALLGALRWQVRRVAMIAAAVLAVAAVVLGAALAVRGDFPSPREINRATVGRSKLVEGGLELWADRPVWGYGSGSFQSEYKEKRDLQRPNAVTASHTTPITVMAEQGIVGLALYIALLVAAFTVLLRGARGSPARAAVAAVFTALVAHTMVYAAFLEDPAAWVLLAAGAVLAAAQKSSSVSSSVSET